MRKRMNNDQEHSDHINRWLYKQIDKVQEIEEEFTRLWDQRVELAKIDRSKYDRKKKVLLDEMGKRFNILEKINNKEDISEIMPLFNAEFLRIENEVHLEVNPLIENIDKRLEKLKYYYHPGKDFSYPELQRKDLMYKNPVSEFLLKFKIGDKVRLIGRNENPFGIVTGFNWDHGGVYVTREGRKSPVLIHPLTDSDIRIEFA